jgi:hypothetical protein
MLHVIGSADPEGSVDDARQVVTRWPNSGLRVSAEATSRGSTTPRWSAKPFGSSCKGARL